MYENDQKVVGRLKPAIGRGYTPLIGLGYLTINQLYEKFKNKINKTMKRLKPKTEGLGKEFENLCKEAGS